MSDTPFGPFFGDLFKMLGQQGPDAWFQTATQLAVNVARGDDGDPNPLPVERQRVEEFAPLVARHLSQFLSVVIDDDVRAVTRTELTLAALAQWKPLLEPLTTSSVGDKLDLADNPMMAQLAGSMGPMFLGFQLGSVAGHFSERAFSLATLPLPRRSGERLLVVNNAHAFAHDWSLERDEVYVFALAREFIAAYVLEQPGLGDALRARLVDAVREARDTQGDLMARVTQILNPENMSDFMANPEALLEGIDVPADSPTTQSINAAAAVLGALFDAIANDVTAAIMGPRLSLLEAWQRHQVTEARGENAAAALFGISPQGPHHDAARLFIGALMGLYGASGLEPLWRVDGLPTLEELHHPMDWWARVTQSPLA